MNSVAATPLVGPELTQVKEWLGRRHTFVRVLNTAILKGKIQLANEQVANGSRDRLSPGAASAYEDTQKILGAIEILEEFASGKRPMEVGQIVT